MSSLPGGPADKAGLSHEALWGVYAMLELLSEQATEVRIEPPGINGAEFYLQRKEIREYWQAKRQLLSQQTWTLNALQREGVLPFFIDRLRLGAICVFASITDAPELRVLSKNAQAAQDYQEFEREFLSKSGRKDFSELRKHWENIKATEAFDHLRRIRVEGAREKTLESMLLCVLRVSFEGPPEVALDCLHQLYIKSVHQILKSDTILSHLETRGIQRRTASISTTIKDQVDKLTENYAAGQRLKLIGGNSIPRLEAQEIVEKLKLCKTCIDIAILGSAGGGKSSCLLQIIEMLGQNEIPVLVFRLDLMQPSPSTIALGKQLDLPESPAWVLAKCYPNLPCVLIIDQLDFISSTSGRHPDFLDTVATLIEEVRGLRSTSKIHLIIACRKFDFEHDHRLRTLLGKTQTPVQLALLAEETVKTTLAAHGANASEFSKRQTDLLRLPQNLALFVNSGLASKANPAFVSQKDLLDTYWEAKQREISKTHPTEMGCWAPLIERLTSEMNTRQELSVPKSKLNDFPSYYVNALVSSGVLSFEGNRYGFGHESFFDYCFARSIALGKEEFAVALERDEQDLFRRAQLRQVLVYLRDDDFKRYLSNISVILHSPKIRSHLKVLTLELLAAFLDVRNEEFEILLPFINSELECRKRNASNPDKVASRAFDVFFFSSSLFKVADRNGYLEQWLTSGQQRLEDLMIAYLRQKTRDDSDRVAEMLEPFRGKSESWTIRLRYLMEWGPHRKSRKFFEFFLRLIDDGTLDEARSRLAVNGTFWSMLHGVGQDHPEWCAEIAAHWLERQVKRGLAEKKDDQVSVEIQDEFGADDLFESARRAPAAFLSNVLPIIIFTCETTKLPAQGGFARDQVWSIYFQSDYIRLDTAYLGACHTAFDEIAKKDTERLRPFISILQRVRLYTPNHLLLHAYQTNPVFFAEESIALLVAEPERLYCGFSDSSFWVSRCLIQKCSPHCSLATFHKLEALLLSFSTPFELSKEGFKTRGDAAYTLLSALCPIRVSRQTVARTEELERKFGEPEKPPRGIRAYSIESPIPKESAERMSDENWLEAIAKHNKPRGMPDWRHPERGGAHELAGMLKILAEREPERFAQLALRFPPGTISSYLINVLYALKNATIPNELKVAVVRKAIAIDESACIKAALDVLGSIASCQLPEDLVDYIKSSAISASDPIKEEWAVSPTSYGGDILTHGINTVRGSAAETIRDLIWDNRLYLDVFLPTVQLMVEDKTLSVRACVASTLIAVANHDSLTAIKLFSQLIETDDRLLATRYAERFVFLGLRDHFDHLRPFVERMLSSKDLQVKETGGRLACLARLYHHSADNLATQALDGDTATRQGAVGVAETNLVYPECRDWCQDALTRFFEDPEKNVRVKAAHCFWHLWKKAEFPLSDFNQLISSFISSKAFVDEPTMLLHALETTRQKIPETTLEVCEQFVKRCALEARDIRTSISADEHTIGKLVFRSYVQFQDNSLRKRALTLIDRMCEEGLQSASVNLLEFER